MPLRHLDHSLGARGRARGLGRARERRPASSTRCRALKDSMRWDEEVYGREYDLDVYHIVAVNDFNMGAMENKGLNVFNTPYVLAKPTTATDADYERVMAIVAHEYFHNWTGNRVTCRDWFQLTLKEGLTVFRDQHFSQDMTSEAVEAHRGRARPAQPPVRRGRGPDGAPDPPRVVHRDGQLLHGDRLPEGRRGHPHVRRAPRQGRLPQGHGPLLRAPRRPGRHLRRLPRGDGRR